MELAGILRYFKVDDTLDDEFDLDGSETAWGLNLSSNINVGDAVIRLQALYGEGVENYMNDAPVDVGPRLDLDDVDQPLKAELLPVLGLVAFVDINWSEEMSSAIGYSYIDIDNSNGQSDDAFSRGDYALANVMFYPAPGVMLGPEIQYGRRENFRDGFDSDDLRFQFSAKYNFSHTMGGD